MYCSKHPWPKKVWRMKLQNTEMGISVVRDDLRVVVVDERSQELIFGQVTFEMPIRCMHRDAK